MSAADDLMEARRRLYIAADCAICRDHASALREIEEALDRIDLAREALEGEEVGGE